jgi:hypothetical protein
MNCEVWLMKLSVWLPGRTEIESSDSGAVGTAVTVNVPVAVTTLLSGFLYWDVMVVVPWLLAVASPVLAPMVATAGMLELQVTLLAAVTSS